MPRPAVMRQSPGFVPTAVPSLGKEWEKAYGVVAEGEVEEASSIMPSGKLIWIVVPPEEAFVMVHIPPSSAARSCIASSPTPMW